MILRVHVGLWRCRNAGCKRRFFTERPLNVCAPHARQRHLRISSPSAPALPLSPTKEEVKIQTEQARVSSSIVLQQMEVTRQRQQQKLELFRMIKQMRAAGINVSQIARQLGLCRRRIDKWIQLDELPERSRLQPHPECPNRSETIYISVGRRAVGMGARYSRRFGSSATRVATRDSPNSFRRGVSQKQRPEERFASYGHSWKSFSEHRRFLRGIGQFFSLD